MTENGQFSHIILRDVLSKYQYLEKRERAFITRVTEGTLEHMIEIDYILDRFSKVKVKKMKPVIREILRSAVYQMKYMDSVPDRAVCNEAVKLAVRKGILRSERICKRSAAEHCQRAEQCGVSEREDGGTVRAVFLPEVDPGSVGQDIWTQR